ncbi:MAG: DUF484 family protein, partial [Pseudomonadota bacterium]
VLTLLEQQEFEGFLKALSGEVASTLRVDRARLVLESAQAGDPGAPLLPRLQEVVTVAPPGFIKGYVTSGRNVPFRTVTLRQTGDDAEMVFGEDDAWIRSEALLQLDLGKGRRPAMLALGAEDAHQFRATQGTDLLAFFASAFERLMRRWLG